jgi:hypothetical protein
MEIGFILVLTGVFIWSKFFVGKLTIAKKGGGPARGEEGEQSHGSSRVEPSCMLRPDLASK